MNCGLEGLIVGLARHFVNNALMRCRTWYRHFLNDGHKMVPFSIWQFDGELAIRNPFFVCRGVVKVSTMSHLIWDTFIPGATIMVALTILPCASIVHVRIEE